MNHFYTKVLCLGAGALVSGMLIAAEPRLAEQTRCPDGPCSNTPTGEDPSVIALRAQDLREKKLQEGNDDKRRWSSIPLYSDSKEPAKLKLVLVSSAKSQIELIPKTGVLRFSAPGKSVSFVIASPAGGHDDICPDYNIKVTEADPDYAIIRMACPLYEYVANRFHMSTEYLLFDWRTSTMRSLWFAARSSKDAKYPDAQPKISVTKLPQGYKFDWAGMFPGDSSSEAMKISNTYTRERGPNGLVLVCTDLTAPKNEGRENEMCEGRFVERADVPKR